MSDDRVEKKEFILITAFATVADRFMSRGCIKNKSIEATERDNLTTR